MGNGLRKERRSKKRVGEEEEEEERFSRPSQLKIGMEGSYKVGKTALISRFGSGYFVEESDLSVQDSFLKEIYSLFSDPREGESLVFEMILRDEIILDTRCFFFVYSITSSQSFDEIETFIQRVERVKDRSIEGIGVLIGNKVDLEADRQVSKYKGEELAKRYQIPFFETSAKTGENVEEMFQTLGSLIIYGEPFYQSGGCKNIKAAKR